LSPLLTDLDFPANILKLDNGLTLIHQYIPATPVTVVDVWVRAGAMREPDQWSGMAHFLEHMIFKGTDRVAPGEFDYLIENCGGITNAATSHDYAHFFLTTATQYLDETAPLLGELLLQAAIPDDEFDRERDVVLEEIRQSEDNPDWVGFQALMETMYEYHPYRRPVLGTEDILMARTPSQMRDFHRRYYQPDNMTVVVVGGVPEDRAINIVEKAFDNFCDRSDIPLFEPEAEPPLTEIRRQVLYQPRLEQARLMMGWSGPGIDNLDDAYGLDLLSVLLADGRSSRLVRLLREELQWVHGISSSFSLQKDSSLFTISAVLEPQFVQDVEQVIADRLWQLQQELVSEAELIRAKRILSNDYAFSTEVPGQLAGLYGYYQTIASAPIAVSYPSKIMAFQPDDLQFLTQKYLSPIRYGTVVLRPL
jgi:predicted Zn-dependent peptidase